MIICYAMLNTLKYVGQWKFLLIFIFLYIFLEKRGRRRKYNINNHQKKGETGTYRKKSGKFSFFIIIVFSYQHSSLLIEI